MREQNSEIEQFEPWDCGTYQTGPSKPDKAPSATITALLMVVIFLGSLASALGIMNVRLLTRLMQQQETNLQMLVETAADETPAAAQQPVALQQPQTDQILQRLGFTAQALNPLCRQYWNLSEGLQVTAVEDEDGLLQEGDIITAVNDREMKDIQLLYELVAQLQTGETVDVRIVRAGHSFTVPIICR